MKSARTIIDTNLWISYLISPTDLSLEDLLESGHIVILFSDDLVSEFINVASRPKFRRHFSLDRIQTVLDLLEDFGEPVNTQSEVSICRDAKDNFLLALAKDGNAEFLVTGDTDLLDIEQFEETAILTLSDFAARIVE